MANTKQDKTDNFSKQTTDSRIAAVRDLIFGENMQQYEVNFDEVYEKIAALKNETNEKFAELTTELNKQVEILQKASDTAIEKLHQEFANKMAHLDDAKADRKKLGKALEKIALMLQS